MQCANEDCGGWVKPGEEIITDAGVFHDTERCLPEDVYEGIVWLYSDHLEEEHREDQEVRAAGGSDAGSSITQQSPVEASPALTPWSTEDQEDTSYWDMKEDGPFKPPAWRDQEARGLAAPAGTGSSCGGIVSASDPAPLTPWSTEELLARERRFMDARLP